MKSKVFYLVHIHTHNMDHYALRDSLEDAQEEVFEFAQGRWSLQFPGVEKPAFKSDMVDRYFQAVHNDVYVHVIDISPEGKWVMENVSS